jgi:acyl-CoA thioesterase YciA
MNKDEPVLRSMPMPKDTNRYGTVFGGVILSQIDIAGALEARKTAALNFVTVAMDKVVFYNPVYVGDVVSFYSQTLSIGNTSIKVKVEVKADRFDGSAKNVPVTEAELTYVALDDEKNPVSIPKK